MTLRVKIANALSKRSLMKYGPLAYFPREERFVTFFDVALNPHIYDELMFSGVVFYKKEQAQ